MMAAAETAAETGVPARPHARPLALLLGFVLLLHLPFIFRGVQSDEVNYLDLAENALRKPLTPNDLIYVFQGKRVDMAGHPHPPLDAYLLAALLKLRGRFSGPFFHGVYLVFPLITAAAMYFLALRFTSRPLLAAALFVTGPVVQVISHTLESDSPTLAFALAGMALFIYGVDRAEPVRTIGGGALLAMAAMGSLQALFLAPVAALYAALHWRKLGGTLRPAIAAVALPFVVLGAWQIFQTAMLGRVPAAVLGGYIVSYGFLAAQLKAKNAIALMQHAATLVVFLPVVVAVFWRYMGRRATVIVAAAALVATLSVDGYRWFERALLFVCFAAGVVLLLGIIRLLVSEWRDRDTAFLTAWWLLYFAACVAAFYAGAARYLLLAMPALVLVVARLLEKRPAWMGVVAVAGNLLLAAPIVHADYQWAGLHRRFAQFAQQKYLQPGQSFLFNGEWGFRYYMGRLGGEILWERTPPRSGAFIFTSRLALGAPHDSPAEQLAIPVATHPLHVWNPTRVIDLYGDDPRQPAARAGFLSAGFGLLPFSFSRGPLDIVEVSRVSPLLDVLDRATAQPAGAQVYLTQVKFPNGARVVLRQPPGSSLSLPLPAGWRAIHGALFARGEGKMEFVAETGGVVLLRQSLDIAAGETAWAPFRIELPARNDGALLLLRVEGPPHAAAGWGGVLTE